MLFPILTNLLGYEPPPSDHSYRKQWQTPNGHFYEFEMHLGTALAPIAELFQLFLENFCDVFPMGGAKAGFQGRMGKRPIARNLIFALPAYMPFGVMKLIRWQLPPIFRGSTYQIVYNHVAVTELSTSKHYFVVSAQDVHIFTGSVRHGLFVKDGQLCMRQQGQGDDTYAQRLLNFGSAGLMWHELGANFAQILEVKKKLHRGGSARRIVA